METLTQQLKAIRSLIEEAAQRLDDLNDPKGLFDPSVASNVFDGLLENIDQGIKMAEKTRTVVQVVETTRYEVVVEHSYSDTIRAVHEAAEYFVRDGSYDVLSCQVAYDADVVDSEQIDINLYVPADVEIKA